MARARQGAWGTNGTAMASFAYNPRGLPESFTRGFGDKTVYNYDGVLRLGSITDTFPGGTGDVANGFTYNPASQLRTEVRDNDAYAWTGSTPLARTYWVNGQNQYTGTATNGAAGATFSYDSNGNLTGDGSTTFAYDSENRLLTASGARNATLAYDPLGRLWQITGATGTTQFLYDGDELVAEYDAQGTVLKRYVHGDGVDDPLFWYEGFDLTHARFPHADRKGSIVAIAGVGGGLLSINTYDEYGIPGSANQGRFQYTGQAWLAELGMYYYKARIYSPRIGRFLQVDPIGYDDQINLYAYVRDDPVNRTDPTGLQDGFERATRRDDEAYLRGEIDEEEYRDRQQARGAGGVAGGAVVVVGILTRGFGLPAVAKWGAKALATRAHQSARAAWNSAWREAGFRTAGDVGKVVGWGTGRNAAADTLAQAGKIDHAAVAAMKEGGLTRKLAESALRLYRTASKVDKGDKVSEARAELMKKILEHWR